jgi:ornithine carbamoyltransferase
MIRTFDHQDVVDLANYGSIPVINGLTDLLHPCQVLTDLFTILEKKRILKGLKIAYIGDGNNMAHSLLHGCSKVGIDLSIASPSGYAPQKKIVSNAEANAKYMGSKIEILDDPVIAVKDADIIYTDVWASMGQEKETNERRKKFIKYQVNDKLVKNAKDDYLFMHCLPAHRGDEVVNEVADSPNSVIFDEAENRLHVQKAIMALMM